MLLQSSKTSHRYHKIAARIRFSSFPLLSEWLIRLINWLVDWLICQEQPSTVSYLLLSESIYTPVERKETVDSGKRATERQTMFDNSQDDEPLIENSTHSHTSPSRISQSTNVPVSMRAEMRVTLADELNNDDGNDDLQPLLVRDTSAANLLPTTTQSVRARKSKPPRRQKNRRQHSSPDNHNNTHWCLLWLCESRRAQWAASCFRFVWRLFLWMLIAVTVVGVFWYSYELHKNE